MSSGGSGQGPWGFCGDAGSVLEGSWEGVGSVPWGSWRGLGGSSVGLRGLEGTLELWEAFWEIIGGVGKDRFSFC